MEDEAPRLLLFRDVFLSGLCGSGRGLTVFGSETKEF